MFFLVLNDMCFLSYWIVTCISRTSTAKVSLDMKTYLSTYLQIVFNDKRSMLSYYIKHWISSAEDTICSMDQQSHTSFRLEEVL